MTKPMHYDLTDLRLFVAIAEAQNLTRGAERVHLAASSASHRIRLLEESIGTPLLIREPRGVRLTRAGDVLLRHARQTFAQLEQMHADLTPYATGVRGHVSLWANTHATHAFLPDSLATFLQRHPQVSISLQEHTSPEVVLAVARGEVEVGVVADTLEGAEVELIPYRADRLVLIAPADHPLAQRGSSAFAEVLAYPFVMLHAGSAIHTFTMNAAAALGRHLEVRIQVRSFEAVCRMVSAGVGIGLVPRSSIVFANPPPQTGVGGATRTRPGVHPAQPADGKPNQTRRAPLAVIELEEPWAQRDLKVCVRQRALLSRFAAELVDCLTDRAPQQG